MIDLEFNVRKEMTKKEIHKSILQVVASIPQGKVASYGQVAKLAAYPSHARYVGTVLKNLPLDSKLPWHRVVNSKGEIAFTENSAAYKKQKALLEKDGVVIKSGKIAMRVYAWQP